jgi:hypothetical protein
MQLKQLGPNQTEVVINARLMVFFSYETPVACYIAPGRKLGSIPANVSGYYRTNQKFSRTTSRHINKWLNGVSSSEMDQKFFTDLVG